MVNKLLSFSEWVKQQDPKKPINHDTWRTCAFGRYILTHVANSDQPELAYVMEPSVLDQGDIARWLFQHDEYFSDEATLVEQTLEYGASLNSNAKTYGELAKTLDIIIKEGEFR